jgi:hypothetical protein
MFSVLVCLTIIVEILDVWILFEMSIRFLTSGLDLILCTSWPGHAFEETFAFWIPGVWKVFFRDQLMVLPWFIPTLRRTILFRQGDAFP